MIKQIIKWQKDRNLDKMPYFHGDECKNIIEEVCETFGFNRLYADEIMKKSMMMKFNIFVQKMTK